MLSEAIRKKRFFDLPEQVTVKQLLLAVQMFLLVFLISSMNVGLISVAVMNSSGLSGVSSIVVASACGSLLALAISVLKEHVSLRMARRFHLMDILPISVILFSNLRFSTGASLIVITVIFATLSVGISTTRALIAELFPENADRVSKQVSTGDLIGAIAGITIGPVYALLDQFWLHSFLVLIGMMIAIVGRILVRESKRIKINKVMDTRWDIRLMELLVPVLCVWIVTGFFQIIEIPILKDRFGFTAKGISLVFFVTMISNLIAVFAIPIEAYKRHKFPIFVVGILTMILLSPLYAYAKKIELVFPILVLFGFANGAYNHALTLLVNDLPSLSIRANCFLWTRLISNVSALVAGILCIGTAIDNSIATIEKLSLISGCVVVAVGFFSKIRARQS